MKKMISILYCILLSAMLVIPAYATEELNEQQEQTEETSCSHNWNTPVETNDAEHSVTCELCGVTETVSHNWNTENVITAATCTSEGQKALVCACGNSKPDKISKLEHSFAAWTSVDSAKHKRICNSCGQEETGVHNWEEKVTKEATCKEGGSKEKSCTVCITTEVIVIPKLTEHIYDNSCDPDCNSCGKTRTTKHSYGSSWSRDHSGHWNECTKCGEKKDFRVHYPGPAATEDAPQLCLTCDYVITPQKEHQHSYAKKWSQDDSGHWYACATCKVKKDFTKHAYDSACDEFCNVCDYENPSAHEYDNSWKYDEKRHWSVCKVCNNQSTSELHIPGAQATEIQAQLCTVCGYEIVPVQEHVHNFGASWMYDGKTHWQACICGEQTVPSEHTWDDGVKNKDKTATYHCTQCDAVRTEKASGFPWWVLIVLLIMAAGGGVAAYIYIIVPQKQSGKFVSH